MSAGYDINIVYPLNNVRKPFKSPLNKLAYNIKYTFNLNMNSNVIKNAKKLIGKFIKIKWNLI